MPLTQIADRVWLHACTDDRATATGTVVVVGSGGACVVDPPTDADALDRLDAELADLAEDVHPVVTAWTGSVGRAGARAAGDALGSPVAHLHEDALTDGDPGPDDGLVTFSSVAVVDLGDRVVELLHPGRGHGRADVVAVVADADVVVLGDLASAEGGSPAFGPDCHPLEWPLTLDLVLGLVGPTTVVVPGRGTPVDRTVLEEQRRDLGVVAETVRDLVERGVPLEDALADPAAATTWPFPVADLGHAVRRGYAHLSRSQRRLPLV